VTHVIVHGTVDVEKPHLPDLPEEPGTPEPKQVRPVHWGRASAGRYVDSRIYQLETVMAGNTIEGPAIVGALGDHVRGPAGSDRAPGRTSHLPPHEHGGTR